MKGAEPMTRAELVARVAALEAALRDVAERARQMPIWSGADPVTLDSYRSSIVATSRAVLEGP